MSQPVRDSSPPRVAAYQDAKATPVQPLKVHGCAAVTVGAAQPVRLGVVDRLRRFFEFAPKVPVDIQSAVQEYLPPELAQIVERYVDLAGPAVANRQVVNEEVTRRPRAARPTNVRVLGSIACEPPRWAACVRINGEICAIQSFTPTRVKVIAEDCEKLRGLRPFMLAVLPNAMAEYEFYFETPGLQIEGIRAFFPPDTVWMMP